ncbi:hypothetical protein MKW94_007871 [Papaver nudicaule]|uniref:Uncharacterized protein n=1 Tax=Papaver nudicaule TaxID=74823 RepID=A0AA41UZ52_PAPNU|nr:hypothetical protein [Papaver nudicaule]
MSNFTFSKMVVALALCSLLLGGFSVEAGGRINDNCWWLGECQSNEECNGACTTRGWSRGLCKNRIFPSSETNRDYHPTIGDCCCLR